MQQIKIKKYFPFFDIFMTIFFLIVFIRLIIPNLIFFLNTRDFIGIFFACFGGLMFSGLVHMSIMNIVRRRKYHQIFLEHHISNIDDIVSLTGYSVKDIREDFRVLAEGGKVSENVYDLIPSLLPLDKQAEMIQNAYPPLPPKIADRDNYHTSLSDELMNLSNLRNQEIITDEEFQKAKSNLLNK